MPQLFYDSQVFGDLYSNEDDKDIKVMRNGVLTNSTKYACEYFYYLLEKEESNFELQVLFTKDDTSRYERRTQTNFC